MGRTLEEILASEKSEVIVAARQQAEQLLGQQPKEAEPGQEEPTETSAPSSAGVDNLR